MGSVLKQSLSLHSQAVIWVAALAYLALFQVAGGDLSFGGAARSSSLVVMDDWWNLALRQRGPFQFEAAAILQTPLLVWLLSPLNIAIGLTLGLLAGFQFAVVRIARRCSAACGLSPATGVLAALPGLLAGGACCAPVLFLLLGIQISASAVAVMGVMIPVAYALLLGSLVLTLRVAARRCESAA